MNGDVISDATELVSIPPRIPAPDATFPSASGAPLAVRAPLPPGYGLTYSTQGPSDWSAPRLVTLPGGVDVSIPSNAGNVAVGYSPPPSPEDQMWQEMQRRFGGLPVDEARRNIGAAMRFMATRQYQSAGGTPEAFAKAMQTIAMAHSLEGASPNMGQMGSFIKATQPKPNFTFVPRDTRTGAPAHFGAPGQRPVIPPAASMPVEDTRQLIREEILPGIHAVRLPGGALHIVNQQGSELTPGQRAQMVLQFPNFIQKVEDLDKNSPNYEFMQQIVAEGKRMFGRGAATPVGEPANKTKGEINMVVHGRRAVFDSKTKKFLRYAE